MLSPGYLDSQALTYDYHNSYVDTLESRLEKMEGLLGRVSRFNGLTLVHR